MLSIARIRTHRAIDETVQQWPSRNVALFLHLVRHVAVIAAILWVPLNTPLCLLLGVGFLVRMWAMEAVNHRYFAHRSYATSRLFQFLLALLASQAACRGPLWWAYVHRRHHRSADTIEDPHSPVTHSFLYAYFLWLTVPENRCTDLSHVEDFSKYPELCWLNKHSDDIAFGAGAALIACAGHFGVFGSSIDGWSALLWGVFTPAVLVLHCTGLLSTMCHLRTLPGGYRRFDTNDQSVNRPILALLTLGAGYHNNHHRFPAFARTSFSWYELDLCFQILRVLQAIGLVWDVRGSFAAKSLLQTRHIEDLVCRDAPMLTTLENV